VPNEPEDLNTDSEQELDDMALEAAAGGSGAGQPDHVTDPFSNTFIPFDTSF